MIKVFIVGNVEYHCDNLGIGLCLSLFHDVVEIIFEIKCC